MTKRKPNLLGRAINRILRRNTQTDEEKRLEFFATVIADMAYGVLIDAARPNESSWTDRTRFTLLGYLVGSAKEVFPRGSMTEQETITALAYQRLCASLVVQAELFARLARLEASNDKYYLAGLEAASYDYNAGRNRDILHAFFDALQFPQDSRSGDMNAQ
ncbi:hypothetical protein [Variovorax sp. W2I14]|uniref:hypothetical protein n=1 Tax=Variovorax sp. W2I14 TaxID=3042290 RepID=UPI003D222F84